MYDQGANTTGYPFKVRFPLQIDLELAIHNILESLPKSSPFTPVTIQTLPLDQFTKPKLTPSPKWSLPDVKCCISLEPVRESPSILLGCGHAFLIESLQEYLISKGDCPYCRAPIQISPGTSPSGDMVVSYDQLLTCQGHPPGTIICDFILHGGTNEHGSYQGVNRRHFMPATSASFQLLPLLARAFITRVLFTVGQSYSTMQSNVITFGTIHLKTSTSGGPESHGYPDPLFHTTMLQELKDAGVIE